MYWKACHSILNGHNVRTDRGQPLEVAAAGGLAAGIVALTMVLARGASTIRPPSTVVEGSRPGK